MLSVSFFDVLINNLFNLTTFVVIIYILYCFCNEFCNDRYWYSYNVHYMKPQGPSGNRPTGKKHYAVYLKEVYDKLKLKGWKYGGIYAFTKAVFIPIDLGIIGNIVTDIDHFKDRAVFCSDQEPIHPHLLNLTGATWRKWRTKVRPMFTAINMKTMFDVMAECRHDLRNSIDREYRNKEAINIQEILASFQTNVIGSCIFGLENRRPEDAESEFRKMEMRLFTPSGFAHFKRHFLVNFPEVADNSEIEMRIHKDVAEFVTKMVQNNVAFREKRNYRRDDFMQLMIDLKNNPPAVDDADHLEDQPDERFTLNDIASQALIFYVAGFEATSALTTFVLYELARHQDIQNKLRHTIESTLDQYKNKISYDSIKTMQYLHQVIEETLRMYPCGGFLNRICKEDYKVPNVDLVIEKGTIVNIPLLGIHYDAEYFPDPEKFDPERFNLENKRLRGANAGYSYLPFGAAHRCCIGTRFGLLQSKIALVALLQKYHFKVNKKTKEPIVYHPGSTSLIAKEGVWLNAQKI